MSGSRRVLSGVSAAFAGNTTATFAANGRSGLLYSGLSLIRGGEAG